MSLIIKFSQKIFKNKSKRERNFIIYHFLVKSKAQGRIGLLITATMNIYQTKKSIPIVMKHAFPKETIWKTPFLREPPISEQFFHYPHLCPNFINQKPPLILGVRKLCYRFK